MLCCPASSKRVERYASPRHLTYTIRLPKIYFFQPVSVRSVLSWRSGAKPDLLSASSTTRPLSLGGRLTRAGLSTVQDTSSAGSHSRSFEPVSGHRGHTPCFLEPFSCCTAEDVNNSVQDPL